MWAGALAAETPFGFLWMAETRAADRAADDEVELARAASRGDRSAFAALVDLHKRPVFGLCVRLLGDREEARDAAQEAFARAYAGLAAYDPAQPFAPWVLRIARNHCLDVLRRRLPQACTVSLDAPPDAEDGPSTRELADPGAERGDEVVARRELAGALERAVAALPENYRAVVHLFHVEHLAYKDIAAALDVPVGTVMTWLHRARARLRESLAGAELSA
jgi:RNA polymerase sigma-70 factor (ECF subfamily)